MGKIIRFQSDRYSKEYGEIKPKTEVMTLNKRVKYEKELYDEFINEYMSKEVIKDEEKLSGIIKLFVSNKGKQWKEKTRRRTRKTI